MQYMRAIKFPKVIILTKANRAEVSIMAKGSILAWVLPLRCFLFLLPNYTNILECFFFYFRHLVTSQKNSFLNTPKQQYFMLLASKPRGKIIQALLGIFLK